MTEHEALKGVEQWIWENSRFAATVVDIIRKDHDTWLALVECSLGIWQQSVDSTGVVGAPHAEDLQ